MITFALILAALILLWLAHGALIPRHVLHHGGAPITWLKWLDAPLPHAVLVPLKHIWASLGLDVRFKPGMLVPSPVGAGHVRLVGHRMGSLDYYGAENVLWYLVGRSLYVSQAWSFSTLDWPALHLFCVYDIYRVARKNKRPWRYLLHRFSKGRWAA